MSISDNLRTVKNAHSGLENGNYWKEHYVIEMDVDEIERGIRSTHFVSGRKNFELIYFEKSKESPNILISPGSAGHSFVFAELGYLMHLRGFNVFIMPKHGGHTISELISRHRDALEHISTNFNDKIGIFAEGLGGYATFYLALDQGRMKSMVLENAPAILTEERFRRTIVEGKDEAARRRRRLLPLMRILAKLFPWVKLTISTYLDFKELVDTKEENRRIEAPMVSSFDADPDFDRRYPLSAVMSLVSTPPPKPVSQLRIPTLFLVPVRGFFPSYFKELYDRLPAIEKRLVEVDGGVFWMLSHPNDAARIVCNWFDETL